MNRVDISVEEVPLPAWSPRAEGYILKVLEKLEKDGWDLSVLFCNNACIRSLNNTFRKKDEPTDVLSFALGTRVADRFFPGDIIISLETLAENAGYFHVSEDEELRRLLIHGILHLNGMDHETNEGGEPMLKLQEAILTELANGVDGEAIF
jgi:probable rRNA maturation factor